MAGQRREKEKRDGPAKTGRNKEPDLSEYRRCGRSRTVSTLGKGYKFEARKGAVIH